MIKVETIEKFNLKDFDKIKIIKRKNLDAKGTLYVGDIFECDENMAKYLTGNNVLGKTVVKIIEVEPEIKILSQSPVEELEKSKNVESKINTATYEKPKTTKKSSKK